MVRNFFLVALLTFPGLVLALDINVRHKGATSLAVSMEQFPNATMTECLEHGLRVRVRLKFLECKRSFLLFSGCNEEVELTREAAFDPVAADYRISEDVQRDTREPRLRRVPDAAGVWSTLSRPWVLRQRFSGAQFVKVRVESECIGEASATLSQMASFFSFGIVDLGQEVTQWVTFSLDSTE
jgi:hypothetical protein